MKKEKEIYYEILKDTPNHRSILVSGLESDPEISRMLVIKEEKDPDGKVWIVTSDSRKTVSLELTNPPKGIFGSLNPTEHREQVIELSISKWVEENGRI